VTALPADLAGLTELAVLAVLALLSGLTGLAILSGLSELAHTAHEAVMMMVMVVVMLADERLNQVLQGPIKPRHLHAVLLRLGDELTDLVDGLEQAGVEAAALLATDVTPLLTALGRRRTQRRQRNQQQPKGQRCNRPADRTAHGAYTQGRLLS
jgi:hypothetical protein